MIQLIFYLIFKKSLLINKLLDSIRCIARQSDVTSPLPFNFLFPVNKHGHLQTDIVQFDLSSINQLILSIY